MNTQSPCKKQCKLNENRECVSCGRDIDSIANWSRMSDEQKDRANTAASVRLAAIQTARNEADSYEIR